MACVGNAILLCFVANLNITNSFHTSGISQACTFYAAKAKACTKKKKTISCGNIKYSEELYQSNKVLSFKQVSSEQSFKDTFR